MHFKLPILYFSMWSYMITRNISLYIFEFMFNLHISLYLSGIPNSSNDGDILSSRKGNNEKNVQLDANVRGMYLFKCVIYTWYEKYKIYYCTILFK
jgi:hypothetical protein